ncbi:MAG: 50S ribosomal protein L21, partial [Planctomycetes bacterium]|nr:50S ribosomal protein L21 [Planctomycetota bacterium]
MYAIIEDGGKQYKVAQGQRLCIELRDLSPDQDQIEFDRVLYYKDETDTLIGRPFLAGAKVSGKIQSEVRGPKLYPMQARRRKNSRRRIGHRQTYLEVEITSIT